MFNNKFLLLSIALGFVANSNSMERNNLVSSSFYMPRITGTSLDDLRKNTIPGMTEDEKHDIRLLRVKDTGAFRKANGILKKSAEEFNMGRHYRRKMPTEQLRFLLEEVKAYNDRFFGSN